MKVTLTSDASAVWRGWNSAGLCMMTPVILRPGLGHTPAVPTAPCHGDQGGGGEDAVV